MIYTAVAKEASGISGGLQFELPMRHGELAY